MSAFWRSEHDWGRFQSSKIDREIKSAMHPNSSGLLDITAWIRCGSVWDVASATRFRDEVELAVRFAAWEKQLQ